MSNMSNRGAMFIPQAWKSDLTRLPISRQYVHRLTDVDLSARWTRHPTNPIGPFKARPLALVSGLVAPGLSLALKARPTLRMHT